jgi:hypothetical protein
VVSEANRIARGKVIRQDGFGMWLTAIIHDSHYLEAKVSEQENQNAAVQA